MGITEPLLKSGKVTTEVVAAFFFFKINCTFASIQNHNDYAQTGKI
jgi:hypothetical protein